RRPPTSNESTAPLTAGSTRKIAMKSAGTAMNTALIVRPARFIGSSRVAILRPRFAGVRSSRGASAGKRFLHGAAGGGDGQRGGRRVAVEEQGAERALPSVTQSRIASDRRPRAHVRAHRGEPRVQRGLGALRGWRNRTVPSEVGAEPPLRADRQEIPDEFGGELRMGGRARNRQVAAAERRGAPPVGPGRQRRAQILAGREPLGGQVADRK